MASMASQARLAGFLLVQPYSTEKRALCGAEHGLYEGMVIGNTMKGDELAVNPTKGKQLTNVRMGGQADEKNRSVSGLENDIGKRPRKLWRTNIWK